jgi:hypothetical protein
MSRFAVSMPLRMGYLNFKFDGRDRLLRKANTDRLARGCRCCTRKTSKHYAGSRIQTISSFREGVAVAQNLLNYP